MNLRSKCLKTIDGLNGPWIATREVPVMYRLSQK